jgi:molecular chaperone HscB
MDTIIASAFERLGLPRRFSLEQAAIDAAYLERSRSLHPDFHYASSTAEQTASEALMAELNAAYAMLSDPFTRASHLLDLADGPTASEETTQNAAFLMEMMDYRERFEAGEDVAAELRAKERELVQAAGTPFDAALPPDTVARRAIRRNLNAAKTVRSLLRDL